MTINFNVEPYYDDYTESKNYHRILFKPGVAVQARELTQLQTILQKQVERVGTHLFKDGAMVVPGQIAIDTKVSSIKLQSTGLNLPTIFATGNTLVTGSTSGVQAVVIKGINAEGVDPATIIVRFTKMGTNNVTKVFADNETLTIAGLGSTVIAAASGAVNPSSIASIQQGVYFVLNNFVKVYAQTIILDKYSATPTYRVGLTVSESLITEEDDSTLNDNAIGSYNANAPGAHRYKIGLTLDKLAITSVLDQDFIQLLEVSSGVVKKITDKTEYSQLEKTIARRTFDESGNYTISPFRIQIREHRDNNRGTWSASKANILINDVIQFGSNFYTSQSNGTTGVTSPTHTVGVVSDGSINWRYTDLPSYNRGVYSADTIGNEARLAIGLEPGKAYVQGYEIEKVATEYISIPKARDFVNSGSEIISTNVGNYALVTNVFSNATVSSAFDINRYTPVNLYDAFPATRGTVTANVVGTARVRSLDYDSGNAAAVSGVFRLSMFDISLASGKTFERNVKQIGIAGGADATFTADINNTLITMSGVITASASATVTGSGTKFTTELVVGDYIYFDSPSATKVKVTAIANDYSLTVETTVTATSSSVYRIEARFNSVNNLPALFELPYSYIKETSGQTYTTTEAIAGTSDVGGSLVITGGRTFNAAALSTDYVVINRATGAIVTPTIVTISGSVTLTGLANSTAHLVIAPVVKTLAAKTKTLTSTTFSSAVASVYTASEISLGVSDVYRIDSIKQASGTVNITDWFTLDDGQKSTHYDVSKIVRKPNYPAPSSTITVAFSYFAHGSGDYFSANSYTSGIQYSDIPVFYGDNHTIRLSDALDFRPRKDDTNANFTGTGSSLTQLPRRGFETRFNYAYYLGRKDKISLDLNGNIFASTGVSATAPQEPNDSTMSMTLYKLSLQPYTVKPSDPDVIFNYIDNKRYTMSDIGKLEKRLQTVEYYTALSLLELETKSMSMQKNGLERFKNGFIVDNFEGHSVGDVNSADYRCSIDMENNQLRPVYSMDNINLVEEFNTPVARTTAKYQITGDVASLRYTSTPIVTQQYASKTENVNPFAVSSFRGVISLNPSSDEWFETQVRPDVIINEEGNFDAVRAAAEDSGALGTVWNAWQTQWSGTGVNSSEQTIISQQGTELGNSIEQRFGVLPTTGGRTPRRTVLQLQSETGSQSRSGVRTTVVGRVDSRVVDDRVVSVATVPFIRARNILFLARGLKPLSRMYGFFDTANVTSFITPASKASLTSVSGTFDFTTNADTFDSAEGRAPRRVASDPSFSFNQGDIVYVSNRSSTPYTLSTSPANAVVAFNEVTSTSNVLHLVNVSGSFLSADIITGTISGATATLSGGVTVATQGSALVTTTAGDIAGVFALPNTSTVRFPAGNRVLTLTDSGTNANDFTTIGKATYSASGILESRQKTIVSTRNAEIVSDTVSETNTLTRSSERLIADGWFDPLAQTFLVDKRGGCFLTKVDLFFATKDATLPVTIEIRETVNGYPGKKVLPFSRTVITPQQITTSTTAAVATTVTFRSPVYVQDNTEYALVVISDSNNYTVWISQLGEQMIGSDRFISQQPYAGVLFKSQNASTWSPDQLQDLKFTLYRAVFDTANTDASISFLNEKTSTVLLPANPLQVRNGNSVVKVIHPNHSMIAGANVTLSGYSTIAANIALVNLNKAHTIGNVLLDSYTITVANVATDTTLIGGANIRATRDIAFNALQPVIQYQNFSDTSVTLTAFTTASSASSRSATGVGVIANENNYFSAQQSFKSDNNQVGNTTADKSFKLTAAIRSNNDSLSPMIDLHRVSAVAISNRIDNVSSTSSNFGHDNRAIATSSSAIGFNGNNITTNDTTITNNFRTVQPGKSIVITNAANASNNAEVVVSQVIINGTASANISCFYNFATAAIAASAVTLTIKDGFIDERASSAGSAASKYLTRQINLDNPSQFLRIMFAASVGNDANIDVYYRTSISDLTSVNWVRINPVSAIVKTNDPDYFTDVIFEVDALAAFNTAAVKLVFRSSNTSSLPKVRDLRVIACP